MCMHYLKMNKTNAKELVKAATLARDGTVCSERKVVKGYIKVGEI